MSEKVSSQARMMSPRLHPWWTEAALTGRRSFDGYLRVAAALLAMLTLFVDMELSRNANAARWFYEHRNAVAIAIVVVMVLSLRLPAVTLANYQRNGWMATLPLHGGRNTLVLATAVAGTLVLAWFAVTLAGIGVSIGVHAYLLLLGTVGIGVAVSCVALASIAVRALRLPPPFFSQPGSRIPLVSLSWLEDPRLPHFVAWQNREFTRRWRTSAGAKPIGLLLLAFPASSSPGSLVILLAIVFLVSWYRCLLQSSYAVVVRAVSVARPWPLPPEIVSRALMRFPIAASALCFGLLFAALLTLQPPGPAAACALLAIAFAAPVTLARLLARLSNLDK